VSDTETQSETPKSGKIIPVAIEDEVKTDYLNYAMSVIVARALPDVRDGLKPVHRRLLYSMDELGLRPNAATKKSARIVGDTMGKYHPHGDAALYDALVRLAQDFSLRYPVVQGQGNFGSVDGDPPAAMRYTEAKLSKIGDEMLLDLKKETVDWLPNFDESLSEPAVLPAAVPNLLINGSSGIAVGMATNMPPHNLREVSAAVCALIDNPEISVDGLRQYVKGPDFPTGGVIFGTKGIAEAYKTGRGKVIMRAKFSIETAKNGRETIVFNELPYNVKPKELLEKIGALMRDKDREKDFEGIAYVNDESDREGIRVIAELKKGAMVKLVLNQLFAQTALQSTFGIINLALVEGRPKVLNLKELLSYFVQHRTEVIRRRTQFELRKAEERVNILNGLMITLANIDEVVALIKASRDVESAKNALKDRFLFPAARERRGEQGTGSGEQGTVDGERETGEQSSRLPAPGSRLPATVSRPPTLEERVEAQAQAIVDMRLGRLTHLEVEKIKNELNELNVQIAYYMELLADENKIRTVIKDETRNIAERFGDERRTEIVAGDIENINIEDLIKKEDMVVVISNLGYIKRVPVSAYKKQGRGGKGMISAKLAEEDYVKQVLIASTHEMLMFITNEGRAHLLKVHELPEGTRTSKGAHIKTLLSISANEEISAVMSSFKEFVSDKFLFMATARGVVKKVETKEFANVRSKGVIAIRLDEGDQLTGALLTTGKDEVVLVSRGGQALRMNEESVRAMGRAARGVAGMKLDAQDELTGILRVVGGESMLLLSEFGFGKRVAFDEFNPHGRGTGGQKIYTITDKTGEIVSCVNVRDGEDIMCITSQGKSIKLEVDTIRVMGRGAQGVRILNIERPDFVVGVDRIVEDQEEDDEQ